MREWSLRRAVIDAARKTVAEGLTHCTSGNASARVTGGFLITPTGMPYEQLEPADIVRVDMDGGVEPRQRRPSSEWRFHRDIYRARPEVGAVVHGHSPYATTIACLRRDIPAVHYMVAAAGGADVRCAAYATFGTEELSANVVTALEGRSACLLANHGFIAVGPELDKALRTAVEVERLAEVYWRTLAVGGPVVLDDAEMARVLERFQDYGQQPRGPGGR